MTQHQVELVQNSWKLLRKVDPVLIGDVFYSKLFVDFPHLEHLFKTPREEQSKKLIGILAVVVSKLDHLEELTSDIEKLATRHVNYGVRPEHYTHVGSALLWTLERGLGADWNEELKEAWATCYGILSSTMIKAAYQKDSTRSVA